MSSCCIFNLVGFLLVPLYIYMHPPADPDKIKDNTDGPIRVKIKVCIYVQKMTSQVIPGEFFWNQVRPLTACHLRHLHH